VIREALSWYCNFGQVALNHYCLKSALSYSNFILHTLIHTLPLETELPYFVLNILEFEMGSGQAHIEMWDVRCRVNQ
jgi:hypothetical protein